MTTKELDKIEIIPLLDTLKLQKISDEVYFSEEYSNYISNSRLGLINPKQGGSPEKFFEGFKPMYSAAFNLGSGVHCLTLQKDLFEVCMSIDKPTAKVGALADRLYPIFKERAVEAKDIIKEATIIDYYKGNLTDTIIDTVYLKCISYWNARKSLEDSYKGNKEILYFDSRSRDTVLNCVKALENNKNIQNILYPTGLLEDPISDTEQAILLDVKVNIEDKDSFILKLKSKLDHYSIDKETNTICINDVKTIGRIISEFGNNVTKFSYNREIAMYSWLLSLCAKKFYNIDNPIIKGNYLVVSTVPQYYTKVVPMTLKMYKEGWNEFKYLLKLVAYWKNFGYDI